MIFGSDPHGAWSWGHFTATRTSLSLCFPLAHPTPWPASGATLPRPSASARAPIFLVLLYSCQFLCLCLLVCFMYLGVPILSSGKDWGHEEKGVTEDEMAGWHHRLNGHEFEQTLGDSEGQRSLACCSPWGQKESDMTEHTTERLNSSNNKYSVRIC